MAGEDTVSGGTAGTGAGEGAGAGTGAGGGDEPSRIDSMVEKLGEGLGLGLESEGNNASDDTLAGGNADPDAARAPVPAATPAPAATLAPAATPAPAGPPGAPPPIDLNKAPNTWRQDAQAVWATLPEQARAEIHKREQDMWKGLSQYKAGAEFAQEVRTSLSAVAPFFQNTKVTPQLFISEMSKGVAVLANPNIGMEAKRTYGINMLRQFGVTFDDPGNDTVEGAQPLPDITKHPEFVRLRDATEAVITRQSQSDAAYAKEVRQTLSDELTKFASDPAHPYFDEVADDIVALLNGKGAKTLAEAYEKAVMANPNTRKREMDRITSEAIAAARKADATKGKQARDATGAFVKSGQHKAVPTDILGTIDDTMKATMATINGRDK